VRDLLAVELLREIGRRIELRENVIDALKLVPAQVVMAAQRAAHLVEVAADLLQRALEAGEQARPLGRIGDEMPGAESREPVGVAVGRAPAGGDAVDARLDHGATGLTVLRNECSHHARRHLAQRGGRRIQRRH